MYRRILNDDSEELKLNDDSEELNESTHNFESAEEGSRNE